MKPYKKYSRLSEETKILIRRMYNENIGLRAIARVLNITLRAVQYHIDKIEDQVKKYNKEVEGKKEKVTFEYLIIDELYTFVQKKSDKSYVWSAIAVDTNGKKHYYYHLSKKKDNKALIEFKKQLPEVKKVYCDGNISYNSIFGDKATMKKSVFTNLIESLNNSLRSSISYLTRRSNKHSKCFTHLNRKLANFYNLKNAI
jgi:IS1 family transposase